MKLTISAAGPAEPDVVWDRYIRPVCWAEWSPQIRSVDYPDDTLGPGGTGVVHGPCGVAVTFDILDVDTEKRCWSWRVRLPGSTLQLAHEVGPADGAGTTATRTVLHITGPAPIVLGYAPIARFALGRLVR